MSKLRKAALSAKLERDEARAAKEAARKQAMEQEALEIVARSPLGEWFPDVKWELVGVPDNDTTLVREKNGLDLVIGVHRVVDGAIESWLVSIYSADAEGEWAAEFPLDEPADLGEYVE